MATTPTKVGSELQVNLGNQQNNDQRRPHVAAVTDGRYFVTFSDDVSGNGTDIDIYGQFVNFNGTLSGGNVAVELDFGVQFDHAVAPRTTGAGAGGVVVVWEDDTIAAGDIQLAIISSAGANLTASNELSVVAGTLGAADQQADPDVATLADGRSFIVWWRNAGGGDIDIHARILDAAGTAFTTADRLDIDNSASFQSERAHVAASGLFALTVYEDNPIGGGANSDIQARLFNGTTNTFAAEFVIADRADDLAGIDVAALSGERFVVVYTNFTDIFGRIYDPSTPGGAFLGPEFQIDSPGGIDSGPKVYGTVDGGFIVAWNRDNGGAASNDIHARRFDADGLPFGAEFVVNTATDSIQIIPALAVSGANVLFAWEDFGIRTPGDADPLGVRDQAFSMPVFDYDSARYGDFDNDGRSDILFQNDTGNIAIWKTNSAGAVSSIVSVGPLPAGFRIDGTGNFNSAPGDDILLRSPTSVAVLPMAGTTAQPMQVLGGTSPQWLNSGIGEFTGDGQSDLLFRNVGTGEIATWGVSDNALTTAPQVLGSAPPEYHIVAVDDFTGDHQADILFRHDNGAIAIWRVANNGLAGTPAVVGTTSSSYHVVATGDFDGNGANDVLFRHDNGDLAMWLLNSAGELLDAPAAIGTVGAQLHVDGTGDLNGDGRSDIVFRDANGTLGVWLMNGTALAAPAAILGGIAVDYSIAAHHFELI